MAALLTAYDLDPGDVIHVDTGVYELERNVVLEPQDSGVRIEGPWTGAAVLDRGNPLQGSYVIELAGADDVTLDRLQLTGAYHGMYGSAEADSDRITVSNGEIRNSASENVVVSTSVSPRQLPSPTHAT